MSAGNIQPTKFLPFRREGSNIVRNMDTFISTVCITAVNAQELLSSVACISAYPEDLMIINRDLKELSFMSEKINKKYSGPGFLMKGKNKITSNDIPYTVFYFNEKYFYCIPTSFFPNLIDRTYLDCEHRYKVVRIGTPDHISVAIIDNGRKRIEIFDSSGKTDHTLMQKDVIEKLQTLLQIKYTLNFVNNTFLQQEDMYCQTWIYYYVFRRLLQDETAGAIVEDLEKKTPMERFKAVQGLFDTLTST